MKSKVALTLLVLFFLTANERQTLAKLGFSAWLYRVEVTAESSGRVIQRIRNPIARISNKNMIPVVWRINADAVRETKIDTFIFK